MNRSFAQLIIILVNLALWYASLFVTINWWYPQGLSTESLVNHLFSFSVIYIFWLLISYTYRLFDLETYRRIWLFLGRLFGAMLTAFIVAVVYFYFQPELIITPRRFLLFHVVASSVLMMVCGAVVKYYLPRIWKRTVYSFREGPHTEELQKLLRNFSFLGFSYAGLLPNDGTVLAILPTNLNHGEMVVVPRHHGLSALELSQVLKLQRQGVELVEYPQLYETLTRKVALSELSDLWFLQSVNYRRQVFYELSKRFIDIFVSVITLIVFAFTFPFIATLIKFTSPGKIFFTQMRVGKNGKNFLLYKYRTMSNTSSTNTWTEENDSRITFIGKWLRRLRIDEWPQAINIIKGEMSLVGPRPEQVHIVEELKKQIPYYDERHIVKPGLTGWAQLHVYAGSLDETKEKLQYDLYYIKHRSLLFDFEIILKTLYHLIAFSGR